VAYFFEGLGNDGDAEAHDDGNGVDDRVPAASCTTS
jgi:hypothetical protein